MMHRDQALQQCLQSVQSKVPLPNNLTWRRRQMSKMAMSGYTHTYVHRPRYETEVLNWLVHGVRVLNLVNISTDPVNSHQTSLSFHWEVSSSLVDVEEDLELKTRIALSCCAVVMYYSMSSTHTGQIVRLPPSGDKYPIEVQKLWMK